MNQKLSLLARRLFHFVSLSVLLAIPLFTDVADGRAADAASGSPQKAAGDLTPLPLNLPPAGYEGTPKDMPPDTTAEKPTGKPRPPFYAPKGVQNVALGKPVISSDLSPISGDLKQVTDGKKHAFDEKGGTTYTRY